MKYLKRLSCISLMLLSLLGCSKNEINTAFYGHYSTSSEKYPFLCSFAIFNFNDQSLVFDCNHHTEHGISGTYSVVNENDFSLKIDNQEFIIQLDRDEMKFLFPIEYDGIVYIAEFEKVYNVPITVEYNEED